MLRLLTALAFVAVGATLTACSSFNYNGYQGDFAPAALQPYDLSQGVADAPVIYFSTYTAREAGISVHRLLLATQVDGKPLPGAATASPAHGYQAVKVTPGKHSLAWCWLSKNAWGPGSERCGFKAADVAFEAGQRYVVTWSDAKAFAGPATFVRINSLIKNLDSGDVIFREEGQ